MQASHGTIVALRGAEVGERLGKCMRQMVNNRSYYDLDTRCQMRQAWTELQTVQRSLRQTQTVLQVIDRVKRRLRAYAARIPAYNLCISERDAIGILRAQILRLKLEKADAPLQKAEKAARAEKANQIKQNDAKVHELRSLLSKRP